MIAIIILSIITVVFLVLLMYGLYQIEDVAITFGFVGLFLVGLIGWLAVGTTHVSKTRCVKHMASVLHDGPYIHLSISNEVIRTIKDAAEIQWVTANATNTCVDEIQRINMYGGIVEKKYKLCPSESNEKDYRAKE